MLTIPEAARIAYDAVTDLSKWDSLVINRRKPHTNRAFIQHGDDRICLHRFDPCRFDETNPHPHSWSASMLLLHGSYDMVVSKSLDLHSRPISIMKMTLTAGSVYHMSDPRLWHQVVPNTTCFSLMVNSPRYDMPHSSAPTTKGKGLESMSEAQLGEHLALCRQYLSMYLALHVR